MVNAKQQTETTLSLMEAMKSYWRIRVIEYDFLVISLLLTLLLPFPSCLEVQWIYIELQTIYLNPNSANLVEQQLEQSGKNKKNRLKLLWFLRNLLIIDDSKQQPVWNYVFDAVLDRHLHVGTESQR